MAQAAAQGVAVVVFCAFLSLFLPHMIEDLDGKGTTVHHTVGFSDTPRTRIPTPTPTPTTSTPPTRTKEPNEDIEELLRRLRENWAKDSSSYSASAMVPVTPNYNKEELNILKLRLDPHNPEIIAVDLVQLFGALILWMSVITALVCIIVWLLCNNNKQFSVRSPQKDKEYETAINEAQTTVEKALGYLHKEIDDRDKEIERIKSQQNTPDRVGTRSRNYQTDDLDDMQDTKSYSTTTRTTVKQDDGYYKRDDERLDQLEQDIRRKEQERRREEEEYKRRQEKIEEQRRKYRIQEEENDEIRIRKSGTRETRTINSGQSSPKKQNVQRNEYANRVILYQ